LAIGDVQTLSSNLVVAFSTTVVGLLIGGLAFTISVVRDRLYTRDVSDIEYALELMGV
jgi:biopolymer transport protein ExbB/TolQ